jgi:hypothetical protein
MTCLAFIRARKAHRLTIAVALAAVGVTCVSAQTPAPAPFRLVLSARQLGPVGYRDPLGVISPDGESVAYTSGVWLQLTHSAGGPVQRLARFARFLSVVWHPDGRSIAVLASDCAG